MVAVKHSRLGTGQDGRLSVCDCRVDVSNADMKKENDHGQGLFLDKENLSSAANCPTQVNSIHAVCILGSLQSACVAGLLIQLQSSESRCLLTVHFKGRSPCMAVESIMLEGQASGQRCLIPAFSC